jgi:hypothetical protein
MNECDLNQHCYLDPCDYQIRTPLESFLLERLPTTPLRKIERAVKAVKVVKVVKAVKALAVVNSSPVLSTRTARLPTEISHP